MPPDKVIKVGASESQVTVHTGFRSAGFKVVDEPKFLSENYCLVFEKIELAN
jgi:hypothetical protein